MLRTCIVLALLLQLTVGFRMEQASQFKDCGSKSGSIVSVEVSPCDSTPCSLYKGESTEIIVKFTTKKPIDHGKVSVHGVIAHVPVPFPLDNSDLCSFTSPQCPLKPEGGVYTYSYKLPIQASYPSLRLTVKWELKTDEDDIVCALIPVQIRGR